MATENNSFEEQVKILQTNFINELPDRLNEIKNCLSEYFADKKNPSALELVTRSLHSLAGSGNTFGFSAITKLAREAEYLLKENTILDSGLDTATTNRINEIIIALHEIKPEL